jgi:hypothetical protein
MNRFQGMEIVDKVDKEQLITRLEDVIKRLHKDIYDQQDKYTTKM